MEEIKNENKENLNEETAKAPEDKTAEPKEKKTRAKDKELLSKIEELEADLIPFWERGKDKYIIQYTFDKIYSPGRM